MEVEFGWWWGGGRVGGGEQTHFHVELVLRLS